MEFNISEMCRLSLLLLYQTLLFVSIFSVQMGAPPFQKKKKKKAPGFYFQQS